jgi:hypothetical protein
MKCLKIIANACTIGLLAYESPPAKAFAMKKFSSHPIYTNVHQMARSSKLLMAMMVTFLLMK